MRTNKFVKKNYVNELLAIIKGNFTENELKKKIANYHEKDIADNINTLLIAACCLLCLRFYAVEQGVEIADDHIEIGYDRDTVYPGIRNF